MKTLKVIIEFEDEIWTIEGEEAEKWQAHNFSVASLAQNHGMNPFQFNPIKWSKKKK